MLVTANTRQIKQSKMRIVFMGTPEFAVPTLQRLHESAHEVVAVVTSTDKYGGRGGKKLIESAVKQYALSQDLPVLQPNNLKAPDFIKQLASYQADIQVVVAFRMLPVVVWDMPPLGTYNLHGSLLPKYRGAAPINWAVAMGETETGVTFFKLKHEIDTGAILTQKSIPIGDYDTAGSMYQKLMVLGAEVVLAGVQTIATGDYTLQKQDDSLVTKAPKIYRETCEINFDQPARQVYNFIRGMSPYPGAWTMLDGKETKIVQAEISDESAVEATGTLLSDNKGYLKYACVDGYVVVKALKMTGKKQMDIRSFLNGYKLGSTD